MRMNERIVFQRILFPTDLTPETTDGLEYVLMIFSVVTRTKASTRCAVSRRPIAAFRICWQSRC